MHNRFQEGTYPYIQRVWQAQNLDLASQETQVDQSGGEVDSVEQLPEEK